MEELLGSIGLPALLGSVRLEKRSVSHIAGWGCRVELPHEHEHRTLKDIAGIIEAGNMAPEAGRLAIRAFSLLAEAEGRVHGKPASDVHFHEVGALDSILDICMTCALFVRLGPERFVCSPLPMGEGGVQCAPWLDSVSSSGRAGTSGRHPRMRFLRAGGNGDPTAVALLRALGAEFGRGPACGYAPKRWSMGIGFSPALPTAPYGPGERGCSR